MTDLEIKQYIDKHHGVINAQNVIMDILNTSNQIVDENYNFDTHKMTLKTQQNVFTFTLI